MGSAAIRVIHCGGSVDDIIFAVCIVKVSGPQWCCGGLLETACASGGAEARERPLVVTGDNVYSRSVVPDVQQVAMHEQFVSGALRVQFHRRGVTELGQSLEVLRGQHSHKEETRTGIYPAREVLVDGVIGWQYAV